MESKEDAPATDDGLGASTELSMQVQHAAVEGVRSHQEQVLHGEGSGAGHSQSGLQCLNPDVLVQVFSYLPQTDLFEVVAVCRHWEKTVMEARVLWKEVIVRKSWDLGGRDETRADIAGDQMIQGVLNLSQQVSFSKGVGFMAIMSVAGVERPNHRCLFLPRNGVCTATFSTLLSDSPQLERLKFDGEPLGGDPIHISHPTLQVLDMECHEPRPLTIHCPNLTHLCTIDSFPIFHTIAVPTSLFCPRLIKLCLAAMHCAPAVLEFMALHAPDIELLEVNCGGEDRFGILTQFKSVCRLGVRDYAGVSPNILDKWLLLDTLELHYLERGEIVHICHQRLRSLSVYEAASFAMIVLSCPSLEKLVLDGTDNIKKCLEQLNSMCPNLKHLRVDMIMSRDEPLSAYHKTMEEMTMINFIHDGVKLTCLHLTTLHFYYQFGPMVLPHVEADCPNLKELGVRKYQNLVHLPSLLNSFPELESLCFSDTTPSGEKLVLVHLHVHKVWITRTTWLPQLVLSMPNLGELYIYKSSITKLTVVSNKSVTLESTAYEGSSCEERKKVYGGKDSLTLEIQHEKEMLKVVHGDNGVWMEHDN